MKSFHKSSRQNLIEPRAITDFMLLTVIGAGSFGKVYLAKQVE